MKHIISITKPQKDYELLDSGDNHKLERFGDVILDRPDPQALWKPNLPMSEWRKADAHFSGEKGEGWVLHSNIPEKWEIKIDGLSFWIHLGSFKHTGIFPEHMSNWQWITEALQGATKDTQVLNLFGYTGGATLAASRAGASVVHIDGSKSAIGWARANAASSGLAENPIRWILDDAKTFLQREIKREKRYHGIIMDPPAFGHGPDGEMWKIEDDFIELLDLCKKVLVDKPLFILINGYASGYSPIAYHNNLIALMKEYGGEVEMGEITIEETGSGRLLPAGIFARWRSDAKL